MIEKKKIIGICGSASQNSGNLSILKYIAAYKKSEFDVELVNDLSEFPHFQTELTDKGMPQKISDFRNKISQADGIFICTPEYVFSIPSRLKNILEWCVSTTIFSDKPVGLITASASGKKGHEELKLIMETIQATFTQETTLLISGIKGKVSKTGEIIDGQTKLELQEFVGAFESLVEDTGLRN